MKRGRAAPKVGVETVRQRGGDCLESVRQRVVVVREDERMETGEEILQYNQREQQERQRMKELRVTAQMRGEKAQQRLEKDKWLEEKMLREEQERKESVRLIEMLRTARILHEAPTKASVPAPSQQSDRESQRVSSPDLEPVSITDSGVEISRVKPRVTFSDRSKVSKSKAQPSQQKESFPQHKERQFVKLGAAIKPLDDTEEVSSLSALSTIAEESERVTSQSLRADTQTSDKEPTPFPLSSITTDRDGKAERQNINLSDVRRIIDRAKKQGERLPLTETHFQTIAGNGYGSTNKMDSDNGGKKDKYALNQQFIKKVLDFSSSSPLSSFSSDESSSFLPLKKSLPSSRISKAKTVPVTKSKLPTSEPVKKPNFSPILKPQSISRTSDDTSVGISSQSLSLASSRDVSHKENKGKSEVEAELRRYIVRLLQMKQEEIEKLSVHSEMESSSTDQDLKIDCDKILELYQSTRSNLQSKLSKSKLPK